jgi:hypothetical protein
MRLVMPSSANAIAEADPVQKVTIVGRGQAGGVTWFRPDEDRILMSRKKMLATFAMALGGRAAEELIFDDITSGASGDIEQVTRMARAMVTRLGMSSEMGTMTYGQKGRTDLPRARDFRTARLLRSCRRTDRPRSPQDRGRFVQASQETTPQEISQAVGRRCQETPRS